MELFQFGTDPWGQEILIRLSWGLLTVAFFSGIAVVLLHVIYAVVWRPKLAVEGGGAPTGGDVNVPEKVVRHTGAARIFHGVMAASMLVLLATGFLPIVGLEFAWLNIHWITGIILIVCILYHIVHASFFLDFWSIWLLPSDFKEAMQRTQRQFGKSVDVGKHGKYPLDHKLYHVAVSVFGLIVSATGILMMMRIDNPLLARNETFFTDPNWGIVYTLHGFSSVLFVFLTITHIYFAIRPEKLWMTRAMIFGSVSREDFLAHHDPKKWVVTEDGTEG
jgi:cytochrome b subunit of formate dehydrogenase